ncbi:MAG: hypothetical protein SPG93_03460 [Prevotella sp.]|nr:hypothetical protein [Bacteroidales bacterium]MCI7653748.1 hypothetical protein [Bacteroidales bacterium]MDY5320714.1 hypothetical protein [Prevotella sp.]
MTATEQTIQQIERMIRKVAQKFPASDDASIITDIHLCVNQDSGEMLAFDDDDKEITRCVIEQWIDNKDKNFYDKVKVDLRNTLKRLSSVVDNLGILKPYSFVLEDDEKHPLGELYVADDETIILGGDLMEGLDKDLEDFFDDLMEEK